MVWLRCFMTRQETPLRAYNGFALYSGQSRVCHFLSRRRSQYQLQFLCPEVEPRAALSVLQNHPSGPSIVLGSCPCLLVTTKVLKETSALKEVHCRVSKIRNLLLVLEALCSSRTCLVAMGNILISMMLVVRTCLNPFSALRKRLF